VEDSHVKDAMEKLEWEQPMSKEKVVTKPRLSATKAPTVSGAGVPDFRQLWKEHCQQHEMELVQQLVLLFQDAHLSPAHIQMLMAALDVNGGGVQPRIHQFPSKESNKSSKTSKANLSQAMISKSQVQAAYQQTKKEFDTQLNAKDKEIAKLRKQLAASTAGQAPAASAASVRIAQRDAALERNKGKAAAPEASSSSALMDAVAAKKSLLTKDFVDSLKRMQQKTFNEPMPVHPAKSAKAAQAEQKCARPADKYSDSAAFDAARTNLSGAQLEPHEKRQVQRQAAVVRKHRLTLADSKASKASKAEAAEAVAAATRKLEEMAPKAMASANKAFRCLR
jgi:hypothetical protein